MNSTAKGVLVPVAVVAGVLLVIVGLVVLGRAGPPEGIGSGVFPGVTAAVFPNATTPITIQLQPGQESGKSLVLVSEVDVPEEATAGGRYSHLLCRIKVPQDEGGYGKFNDWGHWSGTAYAEYQDLPPGYWVYATPYWYIWQDKGEAPEQSPFYRGEPRSWGPEQATGEPDTAAAGDYATAWASRSADGQDEWLLLEYDEPVQPIAVLVYESYNPGAVDKIAGFTAAGKEEELWAGADPTPTTEQKGISVIPLCRAFETKTVRIHVASGQVDGWNEIDAVGLLDAEGTTHWAVAAAASSTYAEPWSGQASPFSSLVIPLEAPPEEPAPRE